jgi:hypothetical protein
LPAVSSALVELLSDDFGSIDEIHIALTHGNRNRVGLATLHTLLAQPGRPFRVFERGRWQAQEGWRRRERVRFAAPVGRRSVYRCDAPDLALFPEHYGARSVTFHEGLQLAAFNRGLRWLGRLRRWGLLKQPPRFARPLLGASRAFARLGDASGALRVLVRGRKGRQELERYADLMARDASGPLIACAPAIALVRRWVHAPRVPAGASPCVGLVSLQEITAELRAGDIVLVRG